MRSIGAICGMLLKIVTHLIVGDIVQIAHVDVDGDGVVAQSDGSLHKRQRRRVRLVQDIQIGELELVCLRHRSSALATNECPYVTIGRSISLAVRCDNNTGITGAV
jgi:hypothetical protein